jgi:hypothetical protein
MAKRDRARSRDAFDLPDQEVDRRWHEIVASCRRPKLQRAESAWTELGEKYRSLGDRSSS